MSKLHLIAMRNNAEDFELLDFGSTRKEDIMSRLRLAKRDGWGIAWAFRGAVSCDDLADTIRSGQVVASLPTCSVVYILDPDMQSVYRAGEPC